MNYHNEDSQKEAGPENMDYVDEVESKQTLKRQEIEPQDRQLIEDMDRETSPKRTRRYTYKYHSDSIFNFRQNFSI